VVKEVGAAAPPKDESDPYRSESIYKSVSFVPPLPFRFLFFFDQDPSRLRQQQRIDAYTHPHLLLYFQETSQQADPTTFVLSPSSSEKDHSISFSTLQRFPPVKLLPNAERKRILV